MARHLRGERTLNEDAHDRALRLVSVSLRAPDVTRRPGLPWTPVSVLIALWALGMESDSTAGGLTYLLPVIALVMILVRLVRVRRLRAHRKS